MECLDCGFDLDQFANWTNYLDTIECPHCNAKFKVNGEEGYIPEDNECYDVFWLEKVV